MKIKQITESGTTSGAIASVSAPLGATQKRAGSLFKGKKTKKKFYEGQMKDLAYDLQRMDNGNFIKKYGKPKEYFYKLLGKPPVSESELNEEDLIIVPGMRRSKDMSFIPHKDDRRDHEVEMARSEIYAAAKDAMRIFKLLKDRTEDQGIMGWQQSYITLASDYLNSVADSLDYDANVQEMTGGVLAGGMSNVEEGVTEGTINAAQALRDFNAMAKVKDKLTYNGIKEAGHADKILNAISACSAFVNHFKNNKDLNSAKIFDTLRSELIAFKNGDITTLYHLIQRGSLDKINLKEEGVAEAAGSLTFAGKDPNEFQSPKGGKPVMVVVTDQGSRYLITSDGMVLRNKSAHANTGGEDAGLQAWSDKIEFYDRSKPLIAGAMQPLSFPDAVSNLFDKGRIALTKDAEGKRVALILDNSQWRPATIADAMPKAAASKPEWAKIVIKADAGTWGMQPKLGWQPLDYNQRGDGTLNRVHNGSPVSHGAKVTQGVAEGVPQPGPSSGAPKQFGPDAKIQTRQMTVKDIISSVPGVPYYNNVVDDWDAKDYSWGVTKKVIEYATYLKDHPESLAKLPPAIVLNGKFEDGAHRVSAIWLLQQRMDPKNPLWKNAKLNVQFVKQGVAEGSDVEYVVVIRDEHGKRSIRVSALTPTDAKEKAEAQGYKVIKVKDPREAHYFREQSVAETLDINSDSDDAKIEQLKKLLYLDRSHKKEFGSSAGLTQKQLAAARDEIRRLSTGQIQSKSTEKVSEAKCPKCGGPSYQDTKIAEEKDACYHKVKSRYKVWPSAYASGALVKCRKVGASNWGNKSKK